MNKLRYCLMGVLFFLLTGLHMSSYAMSDMQNRAAIYMLGLNEVLGHKRIETFSSPGNDNCAPSSTRECIEYVAGSYASHSERLRAARACSGNHGLACVKYVSTPYSNFEERETAARSCAGNYGKECVEFVTGPYASQSERVESAHACRYADVDCVRAVAGPYTSLKERIEAAKACGGN